MKKLTIILISFFSVMTVWSQPVSWKTTARKLADKTYEVRRLATVDESWHIYSQQTPNGGPKPTNIRFSKNPLLIMQGKVKEEGEMEIYHEDAFGVDVYAYTGKVEFVQTIKLKSDAKTNVQGSIEYMACTNQQCLPPATIQFSVSLD
jgi:thiol:disulfide interchange protein DsbD